MTKHYKPRHTSDIPAERQGKPIVAVVGRPNVGKSTLFNRLARQRIAIVHDEPGVTRDRHYTDTSAFGRDYTLIDTGGFDPESDDPMKAGIASHVKAAIADADVIVFVTDGTTELTSADRAAVNLLRRAEKPVLYASNKADSPKMDAEAMELYRLGVSQIFPISALHGRGIGELESAIVSALPEESEASELEEVVIPRIAIIGRPNAGKSSLMNRVLGEDRMLVDDRPGTTRDAIDALVEREGRDGTTKRYVFIDTAGMRRKGKVTKADDDVEAVSVLQSVRAMERSHLVVLMCDAKEGVAEQDAKILGLAEERGRALIIVLNKTDLLSKDELKRAIDLARDKISFAPFAPVIGISVKTGRGMNDLLQTIDEVQESFTKRVGTGELNRFFETVLTTHPPPTKGGRAPRLYYVTQAETRPPTFVAITNAPDSIHFSYRRFVVNQLRKHFGFEGVPVRVVYKEKRRRERRGEEPDARTLRAAKRELATGNARPRTAPIWDSEPGEGEPAVEQTKPRAAAKRQGPREGATDASKREGAKRPGAPDGAKRDGAKRGEKSNRARRGGASDRGDAPRGRSERGAPTAARGRSERGAPTATRGRSERGAPTATRGRSERGAPTATGGRSERGAPTATRGGRPRTRRG